MADMPVMPPSVPAHEHDSSNGVNAQTDWNVMTLKQYLDSELRNMYALRESVTERIDLAITNIHDEIRYREQSSEKAIDKAITQVTLQNEALRRDAEARAAAVLEAVNTLARANETRFAKQEQLIGAVATLEVSLEATRRELSIVNELNQLAINKAEAATEKRFSSVNEFRGQLSDQATRFMPRELAESKISEATNSLAGRITTLEKTITDLRSWRDTQSGQGQGISASIGWIVAAIGVVGTVLAIVIALANMSP